MPYYDYKCKACGNTFEQFKSIANRMEPTEAPCAICSTSGEIEMVPSAPAVGDPVRLGVKKAPNDFQKYVMGRVRENYPGSQLERNRSIVKEI